MSIVNCPFFSPLYPLPSSRFRRFIRREHHGHASAFHFGFLLDLGYVLELFDEASQQQGTAVLIYDVSTAELYPGLHLVSAGKEFAGVLGFEPEVVIVGIGSEADLLLFHTSGFLFLLFLLLLLLIAVLPVVHDSAYGRIGVGSDLYEVKVSLRCKFEGSTDVIDAVLTLRIHNTDFRGADLIVDPGLRAARCLRLVLSSCDGVYWLVIGITRKLLQETITCMRFA